MFGRLKLSMLGVTCHSTLSPKRINKHLKGRKEISFQNETNDYLVDR